MMIARMSSSLAFSFCGHGVPARQKNQTGDKCHRAEQAEHAAPAPAMVDESWHAAAEHAADRAKRVDQSSCGGSAFFRPEINSGYADDQAVGSEQQKPDREQTAA